MHSNKLRKEKLFEAARLNQLQALTLMKELKQDLISDGLHMDKLIKENEDLKRKLEVAHKAQDKLKKEVFDLNNKKEKWCMEKTDLESTLKEERDLLKSTQVNLSEQKKRLQRVMSQESHQYFEGFKCAKSQAAFLCSVDERNLDVMRLWGRVKDGEIVVDDEGEESKDSYSRTDWFVQGFK
jgi:chromosome segregation ATPase